MSGWWAVDFDGTLAEYDGWQGPGHVGRPIMRTVRRVKHWLKDGKDVRIFTARVYVPENPGDCATEAELTVYWARKVEAAESLTAIQDFCREQFGQILPVTCQKDFSTVLILDDRALQCYPNTGELVQERLRRAETKLAELGWGCVEGQYVRTQFSINGQADETGQNEA